MPSLDNNQADDWIVPGAAPATANAPAADDWVVPGAPKAAPEWKEPPPQLQGTAEEPYEPQSKTEYETWLKSAPKGSAVKLPTGETWTQLENPAPPPPSASGAFVRGAVRGAAPAVGGLAAGAALGEAGAAAGFGVAGPVGAGVGGVGGFLVGALGGGWAVSTAQDLIFKHLPDWAVKAIGQLPEQQQADIAAHPIAEFAGSLAPNAALFSPLAAGRAAAPFAQSIVAKLAQNPIVQRMIPAAVMAGQEAGTELAEGEPLSPTKIGISGAAGAAMQRPTAFGERVMGASARPIQALTGRGAPAEPGPPSTGETPPSPAELPPIGSAVLMPMGGGAPVRMTVAEHAANGDVVLTDPDGIPHRMAGADVASRATAAPPEEAANAEAVPPEVPPAAEAPPAAGAPGAPRPQEPTPAPRPPVERGEPVTQEDLERRDAEARAALEGAAPAPPEATIEGRIEADKAEVVQDKTEAPLNIAPFRTKEEIALGQQPWTAEDIAKAVMPEPAEPATTSQSFARVPEIVPNPGGGFDVHTNGPAGVLYAGTRVEAERLAAQNGLTAANAPELPLSYRSVRGGTEQAFIPSTGASLPIEYGITDARDLITSHHDDLSPNADYPQALQPRSRDRAETEAQITGILNGDPRDPEARFRPELMGETPDAANGSPIVGPEGYVESGNARTMAIRRAYDRGLPQAEQYRRYLEMQGYPVEGVQQPVLVRINRANMEMPQREQLARDLNVAPQATMSATDRAMADAQQIPPDLLRAYQGGDVFSAGNSPFWRGIIERIAKPAELPALTNPEGGLSPAGQTRIKNALLAKAYGDPGIVAALTEDPDANIKTIGNALTDVAPKWAMLRQAVAEGRVPAGYDLTSPVLDAVRLISHARDTGRNVAEFMAQRELLGGDQKPEAILRWMLGPPEWSSRYGRQKIADTMAEYADSVLRPLRLGEARAEPAALVENAREVVHGAAGDLFASPLGQPGSAGVVRPGAGENRPEVQGRPVAEAGVGPSEGGARPGTEARPGQVAPPVHTTSIQRPPEPAVVPTTEGRNVPTVSDEKHTKTGADIFAVRFPQKPDIEGLGAKAKALKGYWSTYQGQGMQPGWMFKTREAADRFAQWTNEQTGQRAIGQSEQTGQPPTPSETGSYRVVSRNNGIRESWWIQRPDGSLVGPGPRGTAVESREEAERALPSYIEAGRTITEAPPAEPTPAQGAEGRSPQVQIADTVAEHISGNKPLSARDLQEIGESVYGSKLSEGRFSRADLYDALELGVNKYVRANRELFNPAGDIYQVRRAVDLLEKIKNDLPTQTVRAGEKEAMQQFSTPPDYAFAAAWMGHIRPEDRVLEPSAGTGSIVAPVMNARPAEVIVNELSANRAPLVESLGPNRAFRENAEQLHNILPKDVQPTVVVMNPPFSQTAGRMGDRMIASTGARHVEQALARLAPGGRLVAIVGRGMRAFSTTAASNVRFGEGTGAAFRDWWARIAREYDVRANVGVPGDVYTKYGTNFGTQLLVIDKNPPSGRASIVADAASIPDLMEKLDGIRNDRIPAEGTIAGEQLAAQPGGEAPPSGGGAAPGPGVLVSGPTPAVGIRAGAADTGAGPGVLERPGTSREPVNQPQPEPGPGNALATQQPERGRPGGGERQPPPGVGERPELGGSGAEPDAMVLRPEGEPGSVLPAGSASGVEPGPVPEVVRVDEAAADPATAGPITENVYEPYKPQRITIKGAVEHPTKLVQSAAMASVLPPDVSYVPKIPKALITGGKLSDAQLEAITYAGHAHAQMLPNVEGETPFRRGFFVGDGCVAAGTLVFNPRTEEYTQIEDLVGTQHTVLALTPQGFQPCLAAATFFKGIADLYRVTLDDGREITVTLQHRFLTPQGWRRLEALHLGDLLAFADRKTATALPNDAACVQRGTQRPEDCLDGCFGGYHLCGGLPLRAKDSDQGSAPSQADARVHSRSCWHKGAHAPSRGCTPRALSVDRLSRNNFSRAANRVLVSSAIQARAVCALSPAETRTAVWRYRPETDALRPPAAAEDQGLGLSDASDCNPRAVELQFPAFSGGEQSSDRLRHIAQPARSSGGRARSRAPQHQSQWMEWRREPFSSRHYSGWQRIKSIEFVRRDKFYDMYVPGPENYVADGFINHNTGVGKGAQVAGIILDSWSQGRTRALWLSESRTLIKDAQRDWSWIGRDPKEIFDVGKIAKPGLDIKTGKGIGFLTYDTLARYERQGKDEHGQTIKGQTRVDQIVNWLGKDFDGVIAFDESHGMANSIQVKGTRGIKDAAAKALAGIELQQKLPSARVVYVSATGATEVMNLAYAERLGLWGRGTAFPTKNEFISQISSGGVAAMELVARDMKAMGSYISRNLSFDDVKYDRVEHKLSPEQHQIYDDLAGGWQTVLQNFEAALVKTAPPSHTAAEAKPNARQRSNAMSAFWSAHQRFFNQIITSMQMPTVIRGIENDLKEGKQSVLQLVNTNEASQERSIAKARAEEGDLEDLDMTPRDQLMQMIDKSFPTQQMEEYVDENGNVLSRPVTDAAGNAVHNPEALAMKDALLSKLGSIRVPDGPLEMLIGHFGTDKVAEITGRKQRVVRKPDEAGQIRSQIEARPGSANITEADAFQNAKKPILVFSAAGMTGRSYHADLSSPSAEAQRSHYLVQAGWRADKAIQGFGRTHRTNQASAPIFHLVTTDLEGQRRFISSIARRLAQLGALTKGERRAGESGMFSARDNLESNEAKTALAALWRDIQRNQISTINGRDFEQQTGLKLLNEKGEYTDPPQITQFLNRLLSFKFDMQNHVFGEFNDRLNTALDRAAADGTLDVGTETLKADRITKEDDRIVHTDPQSGAETRYVRLKVENKTAPKSFEYAASLRGSESGAPSFVVSKTTGKIFAVTPSHNATDAQTGNVILQYRLLDPLNYRFTDRRRIDGRDASRYWERIDNAAQAKQLWDQQVAALPEYQARNEHLITGAILPVWDRLGTWPRVYRLQTDAGEKLLGRTVLDKDIDHVLSALGAEGTGRKYAPAEVAAAIMQGGRATLANDWSLRRSTVANEPRIELVGPNYTHDAELRNAGVFTERIGYTTRYFIPTGEQAARTLESVLERRPVVEMVGGREEGLAEEHPAFAEPGQAAIQGGPGYRDMRDDFDRAVPWHTMDPQEAARRYVVQRGEETGNEHIVTYNARTGAIEDVGTSDRPNFVAFPNRGNAEALIVHHNHPSGQSLSPKDLIMLADGIGQVVAHGKGDIFAARLTQEMAEYVEDRGIGYRSMIAEAAVSARIAADRVMRPLVQSREISVADANSTFQDLINRALAHAGIIDYVSTRDPDRLIGADLARRVISESADAINHLFGGHWFGKGADNGFYDRSARTIRPENGMAELSRSAEEIAAGRAGNAGIDQGRGILREPGQGLAERRERFLTPAIRYRDQVYPGTTHLDALAAMPREYRPASQLDANNRGYVTEGGQFLDRRQAQRYALRHDLLDGAAPEWVKTSPELISEFLKKSTGLAEERPPFTDEEAAERIRGGGPRPPPPPTGGPPGGNPPATPDRMKADLARIMHTDDRSWLDRLRDTVARIREGGGTAFKQYWLDQLASLEKRERSIHGGELAPGNLSPTMSARFAKNWHSTFDIAVNHSQVRYNADEGVMEPIPGSKPLKGILGQLTQDQQQSGRPTTDAFAMWSIVKRADRLMSEGREHNVPPGMIQRYRDLDQQYLRPDGSNLFQDVHAELQEWHTRLLDLGEASGIVNKESRQLWEHDDYVPFYRALDEDAGKTGGPGSGGRGIVNVRSPIRHLEGGEEKINNIYENTVLNAAAMIRRSMANIAAQKARTELLFNTDALQPMSREARVPYGDPVVQQSLRNAGLDPQRLTDAAKDGARDLFGAMKRHDPDLISVMDNGRATYYRVRDPRLLQSLTAAGPQTMSGVAAILAAPARLLRGAVVFDPAFMLAHNLRMAQHAYILTGANPIASMGNALRQAKGLDPAALRLMTAGAMSGKYDIELPRHVRTAIASPEYQNSLIDTPLKAVRFIRDVSEKAMQASDIGPRIAVYRRALSQGASEADAVNQARDLLDFSTHGAGGAAIFLAQTIPFLNARWQGMERSARGFMGSDRNAVLMRGALVAAATVALWYENKDDPEYQRKEDWDRQYAWQIKVAPGTWFRLPKPFELGALFGSIPEIMLEYQRDGSTRALGNAMGALFSNVFKFNPIPVAIRPVAEAWWNHDSFTGQPIINEREKALEPDLQYGPTDSPALVALTQAYNSVSPAPVAPAIVQHLLRGYLAGWASYITGAADYLGSQAGALPAQASVAQAPVIGRFVHTEPEAGNRLMQDYYELRHGIDAVGNSIHEAEKTQDAGLEARLKAAHPEFNPGIKKSMDAAGLELSRMRGIYQRAEMNPNLSSEQKTAARDQYWSGRDKLLDQLRPLLRRAEGLSANPAP